MENQTPLVEMRDMHIAFGGNKAVDQVSIDLYSGEVVGLLGHNGAGKCHIEREPGIIPGSLMCSGCGLTTF